MPDDRISDLQDRHHHDAGASAEQHKAAYIEALKAELADYQAGRNKEGVEAVTAELQRVEPLPASEWKLEAPNPWTH